MSEEQLLLQIPCIFFGNSSLKTNSWAFSGVGYLKVPSYLGDSSQSNKKPNENGKLQLIFGNPNLFSKSTFLIKPEEGDFYLFPNYLMHTVYPFSGSQEERRSVSFNAKIQIIGPRPGEKVHEDMITTSDSYFTFDIGNYFAILPNISPTPLMQQLNYLFLHVDHYES